MTINSAELVIEWLQAHPHKQIGTVMRSCEIRTLLEIAKINDVNLDQVLIIGVDCMGTFPAEDLEWRKSIDALTDETLQFARQGGINTFRYRPACQMCAGTVPVEANLTIEMLGLPARKVVMISMDDLTLADKLHLDDIVDGRASAELITQHRRMCELVTERRQRARERIIHALNTELVMDVDSLVEHLESCRPCCACLGACAIYGHVVPDDSGPLSRETIIHWLTSCVGCGMCEAACPQHLPLVAIFTRIHEELEQVSP